MKKLLAGIVLALMVIALPVGLVGCKKSVVGTYKFSDATIEYAEGVTDEMKPYIDAEIAAEKEGMKNATVVIKKDNTYVMDSGNEEVGKEEGLWKHVSGDKYLTYEEGKEDEGTEITIKGGVVYYTQTIDGVGTITYKFKK